MAKLTKIITGVLGLATFAMTAAVFAKTCLPTLEELTDAAVEDAWRENECDYDIPIGFDEAPEPDESAEAFDRAYDEVMSRPSAEPTRRDPIDEGIENIMRYAVNGKTGFEPDNE